MSASVWFVLTILLVALTFDFINGFHDAANSIATVVSTRVLSPSAAVAWAAFWNFVAAFVFGTAIAKTVGKGLIDLSVVDSTVVLGGLLGAIIWDLLVFIVVAPVMGFTLALLLTVALSWILRRSLPRRVDKTFRVLQLVSAAAYSLGHGTNDAQKTMGIIVALLVSSQALFVNFPIQAFHLTDANQIPVWVILAAHAAIGLGTMAGGWRIVKTMGQRITKLTPFGGFAAETSGAITLFIASHFGIPVSTTHTITGAITGVGAAQRFSAVRWGVAQRIVWAWVLTIPASAGIGGLTYLLLRAIV